MRNPVLFTALTSGFNALSAMLVWLNPETNKRTLFQTVGGLDVKYDEDAEAEIIKMQMQLRRLSRSGSRCGSKVLQVQL